MKELLEFTSVGVSPDDIITDPEVLQKEYGLDPSIYIARIPAELGFAGKVNRNNRIYDPAEFVQQHVLLAERVKKEFVDAEDNHPGWDTGPTFHVPARLVDVETYVDAQGVTRSRGHYALVDTSYGRDILVLVRAGMKIGTSSRGRGRASEHKLDSQSPYLALNKDREGDYVYLISGFQLESTPYDLVRDPSANTFFAQMDPKIKESLSPETVKQMETVTESSENTETEEAVMPTFTQEQLDAAKAEGAAAALAENKIVKALKVLEGLDKDGNKDAEAILAAVAEVAQKNEALLAQLAEAEAKTVTANDKLEGLNKRLEAIEAERAALALAKAMDEAIASEVGKSVHPKVLEAHLKHLRESGLVTTVEQIGKQSAAFEAALQVQTEATPVAKTTPVDEKVDAPKTEAPKTESFGAVSSDELQRTLAALRAQ